MTIYSRETLENYKPFFPCKTLEECKEKYPNTTVINLVEAVEDENGVKEFGYANTQYSKFGHLYDVDTFYDEKDENRLIQIFCISYKPSLRTMILVLNSQVSLTGRTYRFTRLDTGRSLDIPYLTQSSLSYQVFKTTDPIGNLFLPRDSTFYVPLKIERV